MAFGQFQGLGPQLGAFLVSADGQEVAGTNPEFPYLDLGGEAFLWTNSGGVNGLGTVPSVAGSPAGSDASLLSADGSTVVGWCSYRLPLNNDQPGETTEVACRWTAATGMQTLGALPRGSFPRSLPTHVSGDGTVIVGTSYGPFLWTVQDGIWPMPTENPGDTAWPDYINYDGSIIAGHYEYAGDSSPEDIFIYQRLSGEFSHIPLPPGDSSATVLSLSADNSTMLGVSGPSSGISHAFQWTASSGMTIIPLADPADQQFVSGTPGTPLATPDAQVFVASSYEHVLPYPDATTYHAFRWTPDGQQTLGSLPYDSSAGMHGTIPYGMSADGRVIVGDSETRGFIWTVDWGIWPLREVLEWLGYGDDMAGWTDLMPRAISANGRTIIGSGKDPAGYRESWVVQLPEEP